jgi:hypothetical protein
VRAESLAIPDVVHVPVTSGPTPVVSPLLALLSEVTWEDDEPLPVEDQLDLRLSNVSSVRVSLARARWSCGALSIESDGPAVVLLDGRSGVRRVEVGEGKQELTIPCR